MQQVKALFQMSSLTAMENRRARFYREGAWIAIGMFCFIMTVIAIAYEKWIYLGALSAPLLIYLCVEKPFIFPFGAYVFLVPFDQLLSVGDFAGGLTLTKLLGIITVPVLLLKGSFENKIQRPDSATFLWILFVLYGSLSALWAIQPELVVARIPTAAGLMLLYLAAASYKIRKDEIDMLKWCILGGGLLAAVLTIYNFRSSETVARATIQVGDRSALLNQLPFDLLLPVSICLEKVLDKKKVMTKAIFGFSLCVIAFAIITTGSRGALLALGAIIVVYVISIRQKVSIGTILLILGIIVVTTTPAFFLERIGETMETGGAGRTTIWLNGLNALKNYWLIGAGLNNFAEAYREFAYFTPLSSGIGRAAHNIYLEIFVELGITGFVLMIWGIGKHYKAIRPRFVRPDSEQVMLKAALLGMLASSFFLDTFWYKSFWVLWMMIVMHAKASRTKIEGLARAYSR
jgi:O-antigen ligase